MLDLFSTITRDAAEYQHTLNVLLSVRDERARQDARWGEQNHPLLSPSSPFRDDAARYEGEADHWKSVNDYRARHGALAWDGILLEEVYEALSERDPIKQEEELIQVAAVAVAAVQALQRKRLKPYSDVVREYARQLTALTLTPLRFVVADDGTITPAGA